MPSLVVRLSARGKRRSSGPGAQPRTPTGPSPSLLPIRVFAPSRFLSFGTPTDPVAGLAGGGNCRADPHPAIEPSLSVNNGCLRLLGPAWISVCGQSEARKRKNWRARVGSIK